MQWSSLISPASFSVWQGWKKSLQFHIIWIYLFAHGLPWTTATVLSVFNKDAPWKFFTASRLTLNGDCTVSCYSTTCFGNSHDSLDKFQINTRNTCVLVGCIIPGATWNIVKLGLIYVGSSLNRWVVEKLIRTHMVYVTETQFDMSHGWFLWKFPHMLSRSYAALCPLPE